MMNSKSIGVISEIYRYPIKSFGGEALNRVRLESYGLYGDRSHAFVDDTQEGWERYITARQIPEMLSYRAELDVQSSNDEYPDVHITSSDGRILLWNDQLVEEIQSFSDSRISTERFSSRYSEQLGVDDGSILIITDRSLKTLELLWGKQLDHRRFRANFLITLFDGVNDIESDYIGKRLIIGNAQLSIQSLCERCSMISIDPNNLECDPTLLRNIYKNMDLRFGMYAGVVTVGTVQLGDQVYTCDS